MRIQLIVLMMSLLMVSGIVLAQEMTSSSPTQELAPKVQPPKPPKEIKTPNEKKLERQIKRIENRQGKLQEKIDGGVESGELGEKKLKKAERKMKRMEKRQNRKEKRLERIDKRQDRRQVKREKRKEKRAVRKEKRQERKENRKEKRQERRESRQSKRR